MGTWFAARPIVVGCEVSVVLGWERWVRVEALPVPLRAPQGQEIGSPWPTQPRRTQSPDGPIPPSTAILPMGSKIEG